MIFRGEADHNCGVLSILAILEQGLTKPTGHTLLILGLRATNHKIFIHYKSLNRRTRKAH